MIYTQEQLEAMSDFELSSKILIFRAGFATGHTNTTVASKTQAEINCASGTLRFDINSWSDMGPLIFESSISIINDSATSTATNDLYAYVCLLLADIKGKEFGYEKSECISSEHENQLRAAAIVYILIEQGGQK